MLNKLQDLKKVQKLPITIQNYSSQQWKRSPTDIYNELQNLHVIQKYDGQFQLTTQYNKNRQKWDLMNFQLSEFLQKPAQFLIKKQTFDQLDLYTNELKAEFENQANILLTMIQENANYLSTSKLDSIPLPNQIENKLLNEIKNDIQLQQQKIIGVDSKFIQQLQKKITNIFSPNNTGSNLENYQQFIISQKKEADQIIKNLTETQRLITQYIDIINKYCQDFDQIYDQCFNQVLQQSNSQQLQDLQEFPTIQYLIAQGKQIEYELIYQGSEHGLDSEEYWKRCNLQDNLLTIMISENGNVFGGFSPCLLDCTTPQYIQDPTLKSFLFQYNKRQIYRLKDKQYAVYANRNQGPTFGNGHDLTINSDFKYGNTNNLGLSYDTSNYQIEDKYTHLFGDYTPKLIEIKVYKVK